MYGRWEGELWFHRWHMWPVPSSSTPSVAAPSVFIDTNSFSKDGRKINVGDCALFKPSYNSLPFVGRIRKLILGKDNNLSLCVNWLYRPADVKLKDGASLEAAPNEIFYSFHKDEIPAASLLHPCKVTFLRKGVEFPPGISSFVCRRVYDIDRQCLCWLTDRNYINSFLTQDLQEEVDQLLDKTVIEMTHGAVQTGGRSPKPIPGTNGSTHLKPSSDNVQNSSSSISSHARSKKRDHGAHNSESVKRDRLSKVDDADSGLIRPEHVLKTEIAKITDKGGLVDFGGVEKLIQLMRPDGSDKKPDLVSRRMLVEVISSTDRFDCLGRFVSLRGLSVLDEWLQEIHKCKNGDNGPIENEKTIDEFLFSLLRALDRLPVNLHALQTCNVGKSVNHLRSHKNSEIQKKARSLVSTWKRRVEAEMNIIETKSSTSRGGGGSWPNKSMVSEVSQSRRVTGSEVGPKGSLVKSQHPKQSSEGVTKSPLSATKEGRSCSSSQSPNHSQSCSSDHGKTGASSVSKISNSVVSHSKHSTNGFHAGSPAKHTSERVSDVSNLDNGNGNGSNPRLIVRLPNTNRSPVQTSGDSSTISGKGPLSVPEKGAKKTESLNDVQNIKTESLNNAEHGKKDASFGCGSYSSINALVESCAKFSEASVPPSGDVGNINLLASVAASVSPGSNSPVNEESSSVNAAKLREAANDGHSEDNISVDNNNINNINNIINNNNTQPTVPKENSSSPLQEDKCVDDKSIKPNVGPIDAAATSVKPEAQVNEESASWSSSDMHADEKKSVHKRLTDEPVSLTPKSEENVDSKRDPSERRSMEKDENTLVAEKSNDGTEPEPNCVEDGGVKLDFDLNEVLPSDDGIQLEVEKVALHTPGPGPSPSPLPSNNKNRSGLITVAAAAKGPFYPSESLSRGKPELGWKGSAATSAFRPAEPRKVDSKPARPLFDFDLNVGVEETGQQNEQSGLDLDLNACEQGPEVVQLSVNRPRPAFLPGGPNSSRDFDLNGPGVEEVGGGGESVSFSKNGIQFIPGVPNIRMNNNNNNMDMNYSTWFPPNSAYSAITIPSQRMLTPGPASSSVNPELFRGPVLSSSPAVAFSANVPPFQYSPFPFEPSFSIPNTVSNAYVDASSTGPGPGPGPGPVCFPSMGPNGMVSMPMPMPMPYRPYFMSLPGGLGSSNVGPDGRKWGGQGLDLNAGPGNGNGSDEKLPFGLRQLPLVGAGSQDEQLKMFQQMAAGGGGGGAGKRKEPDGGWDGGGGDRVSYKHPHWQ